MTDRIYRIRNLPRQRDRVIEKGGMRNAPTKLRGGNRVLWDRSVRPRDVDAVDIRAED